MKRFSFLAFALLALLWLAAPASTAHAATCTVTNNGDGGSGTLREALTLSCDTINFAGDTTITLAGQLTISRNVTIDGAGHNVVISGNNAVRVFMVGMGVTATLQNLTVTQGHADQGAGVYNSGTLTISHSTFSGNSATMNGGGIFNDNGYNNGAALTVTGSTFSGNCAYNGSGGGIDNERGTLTVTGSTFSRNCADTGSGGGIMNNGGTLTVSGSSFSGNSAIYGGGIFSSGTLAVTNSTFSGNSARYDGGGIMNNVGALTVTNSTFSGNSAYNGGGIYNYSGTATSRNSIYVKGETSGNCYGTFTGSNNLADDDSCGSGFTMSSGILLGAFGNYGGSTQTIPLLPGSAAIDAGDSSVCTAADQRGVARIGTCDIGAFESQGFTLGTLTGTPQSAVVNSAFANPLGLTVIAKASGEPVDGGVVSFAAPSSGASAALSAATVSIASGQASVTATANGTLGSYNVTAGANGASAVAFALTNVDVKADTTTTLTSSLNPSKYGDAVTFTAVVSVNPPWVGTATGTVTFYEVLGTGGSAVPSVQSASTGNMLATGVNLSGKSTQTIKSGLSGVAAQVAALTYSFTTSSLSAGMHNIVAVYSGDASDNGSTSNVVAQTVNQAPAISQQPADQSVYDGQAASFSAVALGYPTPTVQWQVSTDGGATWKDIAGATATTYGFAASLAQNGFKYHAVFMNSVGSATSGAASLTVNPSADLGVSMTTSAKNTDRLITYVIVVANNGPSVAQSVALRDVLPSGLTFTSATATQGTCSVAKDKVTVGCAIGSMNAGASVTVTLVVKRTNFTIDVVNTATVSAAAFDGNTANNSASVTVLKK